MNNPYKPLLLRQPIIYLLILYVIGLHAMVGLAIVKTDLVSRIVRKLAPAVIPLPTPKLVAAPTKILPSPEALLAEISDREFFVYALDTQLNLKNLIPADPTFFVGDSLIRGLDMHAVAPRSVNFGISGDNTAGVLYRFKMYSKAVPTFNKAKTIVLAVGINNFGLGDSVDDITSNHISEILSARPKNQRIVLNAIFPVDETVNPKEFGGYNMRITAVNQKLQGLCFKFLNCVFLNVGKGMVNHDGNLSAKYHKKDDAVHLSPEAYAIWTQELRRGVNQSRRSAKTDG